MVRRHLIASLMAAITFALCPSYGESNEPRLRALEAKAVCAALAATSADQQAMQNKSAAYATPNDHHKILGARIGKWHDTLRFWRDANSPPHESECISEFAWAMDGRYLTEHTSGTTPDGVFEGLGWSGYDNLKNKYIKAWIDNTLTGIMYFEGDYDAKTKTFTYASETPDVEAGKYAPNRWTEKWITPDRFVVESFVAGNDGKEFKCFEITYERAK